MALLPLVSCAACFFVNMMDPFFALKVRVDYAAGVPGMVAAGAVAAGAAGEVAGTRAMVGAAGGSVTCETTVQSISSMSMV
jgi:hypothetical protein